MAIYDVAIAGGGPAGLAAALVLARACRSVVLVDEGHPRNERALGVHNFLTRDGIKPDELSRLGRHEAERYGVEIVSGCVERAWCRDEDDPSGRFRLLLRGGREIDAAKLLLATGVRDILPSIGGIEEYYGRGVYHCPYCDGWEHRGRVLAALGSGSAAAGLAQALRSWSDRVVACTEGKQPESEDLRKLSAAGIPFHLRRVAAIEGPGREHRTISGLLLENGERVECDAVFFNTDQLQRSPLPAMLGCSYKPGDLVKTTGRQGTGIPGLFLAGDADGDVQFAIVAAAEGATAAVAINRELQEQRLGPEPVN